MKQAKEIIASVSGFFLSSLFILDCLVVEVFHAIFSSAVSLWLLSLRSGVLGIAGTINAGAGAVGAVTHEVVGLLIDDCRLSPRQIYIRVIFETFF